MAHHSIADVHPGPCPAIEATGCSAAKIPSPDPAGLPGAPRVPPSTMDPSGSADRTRTGHRLDEGHRDSTADVAFRTQQGSLRQSQKLEMVGHLAGGLAHDVNNLLTIVSGSLDMLRTCLTRGPARDADGHMAAAQDAVRRAAGVTRRLLAFSHDIAVEPKVADVNRVAAGLEDLIRRAVGPDVVLVMVSAREAWSALVDANQLETSLLNLCLNARDAMAAGGELVIESANRTFDERSARDLGLAPGQYVSLRVSDDGCGMGTDVLSRAFEPLFTTKPVGKGTGLGLSMVKSFAQQAGGTVRIASEPGRGTDVTIYLPRHDGDCRAATVPTPPIGCASSMYAVTA